MTMQESVQLPQLPKQERVDQPRRAAPLCAALFLWRKGGGAEPASGGKRKPRRKGGAVALSLGAAFVPHLAYGFAHADTAYLQAIIKMQTSRV